MRLHLYESIILPMPGLGRFFVPDEQCFRQHDTLQAAYAGFSDEVSRFCWLGDEGCLIACDNKGQVTPGNGLENGLICPVFSVPASVLKPTADELSYIITVKHGADREKVGLFSALE